jgi:hypothetical protein
LTIEEQRFAQMSEDPGRRTFVELSVEYAQALEALRTIERQAALIVITGNRAELISFIEQFIDMAGKAAVKSRDAGIEHFAEWFEELIDKVEALRTQFVEARDGKDSE